MTCRDDGTEAVSGNDSVSDHRLCAEAVETFSDCDFVTVNANANAKRSGTDAVKRPVPESASAIALKEHMNKTDSTSRWRT